MAFGYQIEFMSLSEIKNKYGETGLLEPISVQDRYLISDDNQMTLMTADGLLQAKTKNLETSSDDMPYHDVYGKYRMWAKAQGFEIEVNDEYKSWLLDNPSMQARRAPGVTCIDSLCSYKDPGNISDHRNNSKGCGTHKGGSGRSFMQE